MKRIYSIVLVEIVPVILPLLLIACGPQLRVKSVDEAQRATFDKLVADLDTLGFDGLIAQAATEDAFSIVTDTARIQERNAKKAADEAGAMAFISYEEKTLVMAEVGEWLLMPDGKTEMSLSAQSAEIVMAHELGHAFGLDHTETGLMQPGMAIGCLDRAAECLVEALQAKGKL